MKLSEQLKQDHINGLGEHLAGYSERAEMLEEANVVEDLSVENIMDNRRDQFALTIFSAMVSNPKPHEDVTRFDDARRIAIKQADKLIEDLGWM